MHRLYHSIREEGYFRLAVEAVPNAMVMADHEGKIVLVNSRTEIMFGYARQELIGQNVEILVPEAFCGNHSDLRGEYVANAQARLMGPGRDLHAQHRDGRQFPVEVGLSPIETEEGTWVLSSVVDITERRHAEAALRESEERFRNIADSAPVMIWVSGPDKGCTFFNKAWLEFTGRTMIQEMGNGWAEGVHPEDLPRCFATYSESFDARRSFQMEYRVRNVNGEYRWLLDDGAPRFTQDGVFAGYIGSCTDITGIKRTQEEALISQKLESVGQVARGIAHDFNNLLGGISATAELALHEHTEGSFPEQELLKIRKIALRGGEIVRQLMTYCGGQSPVLEPIDASSLVDEMLQLLKVAVPKDVTVEASLAAALPAVCANPGQLRQIVMNLVTNASEAIGDKPGIIRVSTTAVRVGPDQRGSGAAQLAPGEYLKLVVSDTGDGMSPEVQSRIFDPFFTTKPSGSGMGLAAVQGIVRNHSGAISVMSSPGNGSRFEILLPCTHQPAKIVADIAPVSTSEEMTMAGTILVVEDEEMLRTPVSKMIRRTGLAVIEAADGTEAVKLFRDNEADISVVLLDMTLPGMKGADVFAELRRIQPDVKVILTTAYSEEMISAGTGGNRAWAFIRKPYQIKELVNLLRDACREDLVMSHSGSTDVIQGAEKSDFAAR
jgi:PAS domain S-box-containing protein